MSLVQVQVDLAICHGFIPGKENECSLVPRGPLEAKSLQWETADAVLALLHHHAGSYEDWAVTQLPVYRKLLIM